MRKSAVLPPLLLSAAVITAYALRKPLQAGGFPIDPYYAALFLLPLILVLFKKFSFDDLGFRVGKPLAGAFFVFLLPAVLFLRWSLAGRSLASPTTLPVMLLTGSLAEEFFFRGYLQEALKKIFGGKILPSLVLSNLVFAFVHLVKGYSLPAVAVIGLIGAYFGIAKDEQGGNSLFYSMAAHSLYNLIAAAIR